MKARKKIALPRSARKRAADAPQSKSDRSPGRPKQSLQWGYRLLASIADLLHEEFSVNVATASRAAAELGREVNFANFGRNDDINEESIRQTVYALRKLDPNHDNYERCWIAVNPLIIAQAARKLPNTPQEVIDAINANNCAMAETRRMAAIRNLGFTSSALQVMNAQNTRRLKEAESASSEAPFSRRRAKK